jgi:hypothetical protein
MHFIFLLGATNFTATGNDFGFKVFFFANVYWSPIHVNRVA